MIAAPRGSAPRAVLPARVDDRSASVMPLHTGLRGLPLLDPVELERATGFVWIVRSFVTMPLTTLGLLATIAASSVGNAVAAVFAGTITVLILVSLYHDTQLSKAIEQLRRGELQSAEQSMRRVADAPHRAMPQRQRARSYLAAIAWARGDLEGALQWTRAWLHAAGGAGRTPSAIAPEGWEASSGSARRREGTARPLPLTDEVYLTTATEVQLLALLGDHDAARDGFARLDPPPPGDRWAIAEATCRLLLAFCRSDAEPARGELDAWSELCQRVDDHGLATALVAWCYDALGIGERAVALVHRARALAEQTSMQRQAPAVAQWLAAYHERAVRYR